MMITEMLAAGVDPRTVIGRAFVRGDHDDRLRQGATRHRLRRRRDVGRPLEAKLDELRGQKA
jgi:hypothetical protein